MAEYVEKAAFREHLDSAPPFTKYGQRDPKYDFAKTVFLSELSAYPAADVQPVRHGRYITDDMGDSSCSECGAKWLDVTQNYCPNCGARLDLEAK